MHKKPFTFALYLYKTIISPILPPSCRFYPSCSDYAAQAIEAHGVFTGIYLSAKRLLKCHPFHPGGYDPVPGHNCHDHEGSLQNIGRSGL